MRRISRLKIDIDKPYDPLVGVIRVTLQCAAAGEQSTRASVGGIASHMSILKR